MNFEEYLKQKHLEDCNQIGRIMTESEWVSDVLNTKLPEGDGLAYVSVNQWMNGGRNPDAKNIVKLYKVFGADVLPFVGFKFPGGLGDVIAAWDELPEEEKKEIHDIVKKDKKTLQY